MRTVDEDGDGRAEVVEFEFPRALDGELAFRDEISVPLVGDKALPANILTDLTSRFAAQDIAGAWLDEDEYEVALADGTRLFYTADGALLDSSGPSAEAGHVTSDGGSIPPGQGGDIPGSPGDNPGSGGDIPGSPGDDPGSSGDAPGSSGDNPGSSGNPPGSSGDNPGSSGDPPGSSGDDPGSGGDIIPGAPGARPDKPGD